MADIDLESQEAELVERLRNALKPSGDLSTDSTPALVVFAGSGISAGDIPGVSGMMELVERFVQATGTNSRIIDQYHSIARDSRRPDQKYAAFQQLLDRTRGPGTFNMLVQHAVRRAYKSDKFGSLYEALSIDPWLPIEEYARAMEDDLQGWRIPKGIASFAKIVKTFPDHVSPLVLTTNFDPLLEIAFRLEGLNAQTISLPTDGSLGSTMNVEGGIGIFHLHGFWRGSNGLPHYESLHSPIDLKRRREILRSELEAQLAGSLLLVVGYGGWDDVFTEAVSGQSSKGFRELLWALHSKDEAAANKLKSTWAGPSYKSPNLQIYAGVDSDRMFPALLAALSDTAEALVPNNTQFMLEPMLLSSPKARDLAFGRKVATLALLTQNDVLVPRGVAMQLTSGSDQEVRDLASAAWELLEADLGVGSRVPQKYIVRSSASVEDQPTALFPGIFVSRRDAKSKEDLMAGMHKCFMSLASDALSNYLQIHGSTAEELKMSVLVQEQVEAVFAGVAFTDPPPPLADSSLVVEVAAGSSADMLSGHVVGTTYAFGLDASNYSSPRHVAGPTLRPSQIASMLEALRAVCETAKNVLGERSLDIEWVWDGALIYVVQARSVRTPADIDIPSGPNHNLPAVTRRSPSELPLPGIEAWGHKGAASQFFDDAGVGAANVMYVLPGVSLAELKAKLSKRAISPSGTTIRFSHKTKLSLPRKFIGPLEDIASTYFELRSDPEWFGIISDFVYLSDSFEAYIGERDILVEHVPGNWETDNQLAPDVFLWTGNRRLFLRVSVPRQAKIEIPTEHGGSSPILDEVAPLSAARAEEFCSVFLPQLQRIQQQFPDQLPLNVHFTTDGMGGWYFLNIRPTDYLDVSSFTVNPDGAFKMNRLYPVVAISDLDGWDGKTPLLISATEDRARFASFIRVANRLKVEGVAEVFCTFGLLSHPAILLREVGIRVIPLLLTHEIVDINMSGR